MDAVAKKPNIVVVISDEQNASVLGCYGNEIVRTPNLDGLARRGVTFENCYCNAPLCAPSRDSFISGKYSSRVSVWGLHSWLPSDDYPSLARVMRAAGYESFLCGCMSFDPTRRYGFSDIGGPELANQTPKHGRGARRHPDNLESSGETQSRFDEFHTGDRSVILDECRRVTGRVSRFIEERKADDDPFFLVVGYDAPHFPLIVPEEYWRPYEGRVPMPVIPEGHLDSQPLNYKQLRAAFQLNDVPEEIVRRGRELYYGLTQWVDEEIGKMLGCLADSALSDDTIVIYTADHGENLGEHGLWWKNCMYEPAARVPLIVSAPKRWKGGQRRQGACSLLDITRTIADLGSAATPDDWNGDSMVPWMDDPGTAWKDRAVSEYYGHFIASGYAMIREGRYKYVYHTPPDSQHPAERELYDLQADPGEFINLAGRAECGDQIGRMHAALIDEIGENPDDTEQRCRADYARGYDGRQ